MALPTRLRLSHPDPGAVQATADRPGTELPGAFAASSHAGTIPVVPGALHDRDEGGPMSSRPEAPAGTEVLADLSPGRHVHLVGIGGIGLSAMARILLQRGYDVSGSDLGLSPITRDLAALGATIHEGHTAQNVNDSDLVIVSSAVPDGNPEVEAARAAGIPVIKRGEALAWLMRGRQGIAVAGTHGKTTVSAMVGLELLQGGLDPTILVGGIIPELQSNSRDGSGPHFVVEADEYDRTFLKLTPQVAVVTSIEMDHPCL
ncbi:MAG TPA: hypothetical protein ENO24_00910, partial [Chloroflexi bacterium]|nr:hypothetical protein [Chloroflexota bacterium]